MITSKREGFTNGDVVEKLQAQAIEKIARKNGVTNGCPIQKGVTNGLGGKLIDDKAKQHGFVNGNSHDAYTKGFTNGLASGYEGGYNDGITSSGKIEIRQIRTLRNPRTRLAQGLFTTLIILAIIVAPFVTTFLVNHAPIIIDGAFKDWADVSVYSDSIGDVANSNIDIDTYKIKLYRDTVFVYLSSVDSMLQGDGDNHDTIIIMADTDAKYETGYQANGLGYDYMLKVSGCYGEIVRKQAYLYSDSGNDWNAWYPTTPSVNMVDNEIELSIHSEAPQYAVIDAYTISASGDVDQIDCLMSNDYQAFRIQQNNVVPEISCAENVSVLNFSLACDVNSTSVSSVTFTMLGTAKDSSFGRFSLDDYNGIEVGHGFVNNKKVQIYTNIIMQEGDEKTYTLSVNLVEQISGDTFMFKIDTPYDVVASIVPKIYPPETRLGYIGYLPNGVIIDGGFAEWNLTTIVLDNQVDNSNIDLISTDRHYSNNSYAMAIEYLGKAMGGDIMPFDTTKGKKVTSVENDEQAQQSSYSRQQTQSDVEFSHAPKDPKTGEDVLTVQIGNDKRVEIKGIQGVITRSVWAVMVDGNWTDMGSVDSFCDEHKVEFNLEGVEIDDDDEIVVHTSDWKGVSDHYTTTHKSVEISTTQSVVLPTGEISFGITNNTQDQQAEPLEEILGSSTDMTATGVASPSITIDGVLNEASWSSADSYTVDLTQDMKIQTMMDDTYVYIGVTVIGDTTQDNADECFIFFDCDHDAGIEPDAYDIKIENRGNDENYWEWDVSWNPLSFPTGFDLANSMTNSKRTYEFQIPVSDLNKGSNFNSYGDEIGFGCIIRESDAVPDYFIIYPDGYTTVNPESLFGKSPDLWGDLIYGLEIPEMKDYGIIITSVSIIGMVMVLRKKRNHNNMEDDLIER